MSDRQVDFAAKFYVRLEDHDELQFQLDVSSMDTGAQFDEQQSLLERVQRSNNRRLRGEE